ncbi:hypothetical protein E5N72_05150 [Pseudoalteromonas sp. MEBiC 03607]|uniref:HGGxSTG domain-containing protein n=1 Tax=Pseudoalteromonas sp. MEBiC 03607 TaxID=2563601 RepID=UPI0010939082|nr:HGGxSTG domain-containing protein [Pseudoalteromonas sp. MEBiC 03607]TGV19484.1 hypothetical protein E5N72_05150 [Pseudoalteromonas sp. MEBiC 03607]
MTRYNLENLPLCGAKTRSGSPCKRKGNKRNGRCKLHGGRSTGAKTIEGKLAIKTNALKDGYTWYLTKEVDENLLAQSQQSFIELCELVNHEVVNLDDFNKLIEESRVALESFKYRILEFYGADGFIIVQSALDSYYKNDDSKHLSSHKYTITTNGPYFHQPMSEAEKKFVHVKKGFKFSF